MDKSRSKLTIKTQMRGGISSSLKSSSTAKPLTPPPVLT